jgi:ribosome-binding protein aMBF1 (putative translation factor)
MDKSKEELLKANGFNVGSAGEFLGLTRDEEAYINIRFDMCVLIKSERERKGWSLSELADAMEEPIESVKGLENGDLNIPMDLMIQALLHLGTSRELIAQTLYKT